MGMLRTGAAFALVCLAAAGLACSSEGAGAETTTPSGTGASGGWGTGGQGTGAGGTGGTATAHDCTAPSGSLPPLAWTEVASGLSMPVFVTAAPGDDGRLFIVEQTGQIRVLAGGSVSATPFVDLSAEVLSGGEQGLLGLAFHPAYPANGRLFVFYTESGTGAEVVAELGRTPGDPDSADPASERRLLVLPDDESNHNGGMLAFGPDGML
ncbi:MAG: PQQ-dependent sugar dehydrogenase, partial [Polyangiaceae bacterium]|nr:PQQ-dependent sugar dehydrogenase [Polyangiaceae bacterium]